MDKKTYIVMHIVRIVVAAYMLYWGIMQWKALPEEIPLMFNTAGKVSESGAKSMFLPTFFLLLAGFVPIRATELEDEKEQMEEKRKALLLSFAHTIVMCLIFLWRINLVKNNLA